jgi:hypothetical protein
MPLGQTQSGGAARTSDQELARPRMMRGVAIIIAVAAFALLVVAFSLAWKPYYQVAAGLAAWAAIEWQRACGRKIKALDADRE